MATTTTSYDIGPGAIAQAGTAGGPAFMLSVAEWVTIQTYVTDALALPVNEEEFRNSLGPGAPSNLSDFTQLIACYKAIEQHCTTWNSTTFPQTVALADAVYEYGANKAPVYYPPILKEAEILEREPNNEQAKAALKAILEALEKTANEYATKAKAAAAEIHKFMADTESDSTTLIGPDGQSGLVKHYNERYGEESEAVKNLVKEIDAQKIILASANAEYNQDVIIASTTPTYAWVPWVGIVAAAVVAGIYGDRAVKALDKAHAARDKIDSLAATERADANIMTAIHSATQGMTTIVTALSRALPVIQKMEGAWASIATDVANIVKIIEQDIGQVPPIIMSLGVEEAVKAWYNVAQLADAYRVNAYVKESGGPTASMLAWKVARHISSQHGPLAA
ncbi:MAG: alpha-xenorhabdolysin family binary toxin subunit A [Solirubrobacteraceae bacterium]